MIEVTVHSWDDCDIEELIKLAVQCRRENGIAEEDETVSEYKERIVNAHERVHYDWVLTAIEDGNLVGWTTIWEWDKEALRISNWHPYVRNNDQEVSQSLIDRIMKLVRDRQFKQIDIAFSRVSPRNQSIYDRMMGWYVDRGFSDFYQEYFMIRELRADEDLQPDPPDGFSVTRLTDWAPTRVCDAYLNAFKVSQDRFHLQRTLENRRTRFLGILESDRTIQDASYVIAKDGQIAGVSIVTEQFKPAHLGPFFVSPDFRRLGLGIVVAHLSMDSLRDLGVPFVSLEVDTKNEPAFQLYKGMDFEIESESHVLRWTNDGMTNS